MGFVAMRARAAGIPATNAMSYSGMLTDANGTPMSGQKSIVFKLWDQPSDGALNFGVVSQR